jgi:hypothetical protein
MALKKETRREHNPVKSSRREAKESAAHLAPPEEAASQAKREGGLAVDTGELKLPDALMVETDAREQGFFKFEPVVLFILGATLAYIAFIAYLISTAPSQ